MAPRVFNQHMKVARLSVLSTGRLYPPGKSPDTYFCERLSRFRGRGAAGRIKPAKNLKDPIGNQTRDRPAFSAVPRLAVLPRNQAAQCADRKVSLPIAN